MTPAAAFAVIEQAARAGTRCPENGVLGKGATAALIADGKIRVEVYAKNWRTVEIMDGLNKGRRTQECPYSRIPYLVMPSATHARNLAKRRRAFSADMADFKEG